MNRKEFLYELDRALGNMSVAEKKEILGDYVEHFRVGLAAGQTEEQIVASLGNPRVLAKSYRADYLVDQADTDHSAGNFLRAVLAVVSLSFFNLVVVLGPFMGLVGGLIGLWAAGISIAVAGIGVFGAAILNPMFPTALPITGFTGLFGAALFGVGLTCLGALACIGLYFLTVWFYKLMVKYLKFNLRIIKG